MKMHKKLIVVADDFTGANDTGVQLSKEESKVKVVINTYHLNKEIKTCNVLVPLLIIEQHLILHGKELLKMTAYYNLFFLLKN